MKWRTAHSGLADKYDDQVAFGMTMLGNSEEIKNFSNKEFFEKNFHCVIELMSC